MKYCYGRRRRRKENTIKKIRKKKMNMNENIA
jgi:hypothetical protein